MERPALTLQLDSKTFTEYYYLKDELVTFCKANHLPSSGSKGELTKQISYFLDTGKVLDNKVKKAPKPIITEITLSTKIEANFVCSKMHREFFKEQIGNSFSFKVTFQKWLKDNAGKTYQEAVEAYRAIIADAKKEATIIDHQFEYNTYIRDFFADNPGSTLTSAIACWKEKKRKPGNHHYQRSDLDCLK